MKRDWEMPDHGEHGKQGGVVRPMLFSHRSSLLRVLCVLCVLCGETAPGLAQDAPDAPPEKVLEVKRQEEAVVKLRNLAERIGGEVASLRGLPFKHPVEKGLKTRDELRNYLVTLMTEKQPKERLDAFVRAYALLHLLPPNLDLQKVVLDLLQEQVAGFYDPKAKALFLINEWSMSQTAIMAHELTHAIQDQHFDLQSLPMEDETVEDVANAIRAVVEGEGMLVMMLYLSDPKIAKAGLMDDLLGKGFRLYLESLGHGNEPGTEVLDDLSGSFFGMDQLATVPMVIREGLIFPYITGTSFVHHAWRRGGWDAVNALYADMPQSTEQVMEPEKYFVNRDRPTRITFTDPKALAPEGYGLIYRTILGQLYLSVLFRQTLKEKAPARFWRGWDGDHFLAFEKPGSEERFYVLLTVWDSEADAEEFEEGFRGVMVPKGAGKAEGQPAETTEGKASGKPVEIHIVERRGSEVLMVGGTASRDLLSQAAVKAWQTRKLEEGPVIRAKGALEK